MPCRGAEKITNTEEAQVDKSRVYVKQTGALRLSVEEVEAILSGCSMSPPTREGAGATGLEKMYRALEETMRAEEDKEAAAALRSGLGRVESPKPEPDPEAVVADTSLEGSQVPCREPVRRAGLPVGGCTLGRGHTGPCRVDS